jgi:hypothetical protein
MANNFTARTTLFTGFYCCVCVVLWRELLEV